MHTPEIRQKFIELRADAHSIPKIASLLNVAQSTLRLWEKDDALEIAHLRCSYWQDAEDKVGITIEHRLRRMAEWIKGAEDELEKRHFDLMNNRDLMRFLREARREYFRLRAMLFNAPGARASSPAATTARPKTTKLTPAPQAEPMAAELPPIKTPLQQGEPEQPDDSRTASAVSPSDPATDKIDKIGELADFPETQPSNTNDLQQSKSSPADFSATASAAPNTAPNPCCTCNTDLEVAVEAPCPDPQPVVVESRDAVTTEHHSENLPAQAQGDSISTTLLIPKSSNPFFYYSPEDLFVPSTPFNSGEPIRLFLARCREADLAAAQLRPATVDDLPPTNTPLQRGEPAQPYDSPTASAVSPCDDLPQSNSLSPQRSGMALSFERFCRSMRIVHLRSSSYTV